MSILSSVSKEVEKIFPGVLHSLQKHTSVEKVASNVLLGIGAFFLSYSCDRALKIQFLPQGTKDVTLPEQGGMIHFLVEQVAYPIILKAPHNFFLSETLNRIIQIARFCVSTLLGAAAARSLGCSSKAAEGSFSEDLLCGFSFAVCREGSLLSLSKDVSDVFLMVVDSIVSSLVETSPKGGVSLKASEWYYKTLSRTIIQITAGSSSIFSGSPIASFVQQALFRVAAVL